MADYNHFRVEIVGDISVVHLQDGEYFERLVINELQDELIEFAKTGCLPNLLISFGAVKRMSSEMLNALIRVRDWIVGNDGAMKLCDMRDSIRKVFTVTNLDKMFEIHDSMPAAIDAF